MEKTAREAALYALVRMEDDGAYSNIILDSVLGEKDFSNRDMALTTRLFYGVLENRLALDYTLSQLSKLPLDEIESEVLMILRLGLYQLYFMDKIPVSAAVNESVRLCAGRKLYSAKGFVNGVLRAASRRGSLFMPDESDRDLYLSVAYSCPLELIQLWTASYGRDRTEEILKSLSGRPPVYARVNTLNTDKETLKAILMAEDIKAQDTICKNSLCLSDTGSIKASKAYNRGFFHIQDISSQLCCEALNVQEGQTVIDACSAPGGKSFTLAQLMKNQGRLIAGDMYRPRLNLVEEGAKRLGISIISTVLADASQAEYPMADRILCDVPCSGLGVIRRKPELRYKKDLGLKALPELQYKILCSCSKYLKPGGLIVYSTCTLNPTENQLNARRFLSEHPDFEPQPLALRQKKTAYLEERENELTLFPQDGTDGFFISAFRKRGITL